MAPKLARHECVLHYPANTGDVEGSIRRRRPSHGNSRMDCWRAQTRHTVSPRVGCIPRTCHFFFRSCKELPERQDHGRAAQQSRLGSIELSSPCSGKMLLGSCGNDETRNSTRMTGRQTSDSPLD
jgi:hypothetical protein